MLLIIYICVSIEKKHKNTRKILYIYIKGNCLTCFNASLRDRNNSAVPAATEGTIKGVLLALYASQLHQSSSEVQERGVPEILTCLCLFLLLVVRMLLVAMPGAPSSFLLLV